MEELRQGRLPALNPSTNNVDALILILQRSLWLRLEGLVLVEQVSEHGLRCYWSNLTSPAQEQVASMARESSVVLEHAASSYTNDELRTALAQLHENVDRLRRLGVDLVDCYAAPEGLAAIGRCSADAPDQAELDQIGGPLVVWHLTGRSASS